MKEYFEIIKKLYGIDTLKGYAKEEMAILKQKFHPLPHVLEEYYHTAAQAAASHFVQDNWISPHELTQPYLDKLSNILPLLYENQGICYAGILKKDLCLSNPPVYTFYDDKTWELCAPKLNEFILAALLYESCFTFEYCAEDFFSLTQEELETIQAQLTKYPFQIQSWIDHINISFYHNACDNLAVVFTFQNGDLQLVYGAASLDSYKALLCVLKNIGEPL